MRKKIQDDILERKSQNDINFRFFHVKIEIIFYIFDEIVAVTATCDFIGYLRHFLIFYFTFLANDYRIMLSLFFA